MSNYIYEAQVEVVTVDYFGELGYEYIRGPVIAPDGEAPERAVYAQVMLSTRLRDIPLPNFLNGEIELPEDEPIADEVET